MARVAAVDRVEVAPTNNIYTVLAIAGTVAVGIGLLVLFIRATALGVTLF